MIKNIEEVTKDQIAAEIITQPANEWLTEQYLPFAMYAIMSRALVDDDGLKPVNRRILYSMFRDGSTPNSEFMKAARTAANAVAFHPHGGASVEDALVRMAQAHNLRVPLVEAYGTVGQIAGDEAAASRYWECRLSPASIELLKEIPDGAVEIGKNFDGKLDEPHLLPVRWPNDIINGTQGIAVGYASDMPAHNPDEVMKACIAALRDPNFNVDKLLKIMPGPDVASGGELLEIDGVREYYETGAGRFTLRGRYNVEKLPRGRVRIVFYELPYQVSPASVIVKIREAQDKGKLKEISVMKDLSDMENGMKLILETKSGSNHLSVINELFKSTPVEKKFSVNSTVLLNGTPTKVGMIELINRFISFRKECTARKAKTRMVKIDARIHQLNALLAAIVDIDKCIAIIRNSNSAELARTGLMKQFNIDEEQADYILSMQLRRLTKADSVTLNAEQESLLTEQEHMKKLLSSEELLNAEIESDIRKTLKVITDPRRTIISGLTSDQVKEMSRETAQAARNVEKSVPCFITRFADGRILRTDEEFSYSKNLKRFPNSPMVEQIKVKTQDSILIVGSDGIARVVPMSYVTTDKAVAVNEIGVNLPKNVKIVALGKMEPMKTDVGLVLASRNGDAKLVRPEFPANKEEFVVYNVADGDELISGRWLGRALTNSSFVSITSGNSILVYSADLLRATGAAAGGVKSQKLREGEHVVFFGWVPSAKDNATLIISQAEATIKMTPISEIPPKGKGSQGVTLHKLKANEKSLKNAFVGEELIVATAGTNKAISLPPVTRRATVGVDFRFASVFGQGYYKSM